MSIEDEQSDEEETKAKRSRPAFSMSLRQRKEPKNEKQANN